ncbi:hypothetical protein DFH11DRAFT_1879283 [Phellopilus nigrolimitatus]|nr:hypothetical protein DFH11DRAFT_1879283 [Phellopilus nigrolimitatus]
MKNYFVSLSLLTSLLAIIDDDHAIISTSSGPEFYVSIMSFAIVGVLQDDTDPMVSVMKLDKAPTESYADEAVELPLTHPELHEEMSIRPPKDAILYGMPGMGKMFLAEAVANQTSATFLRVVSSELIQKYLGDGPNYGTTSGGGREIQHAVLELLNHLDGIDTHGDAKSS